MDDRRRSAEEVFHEVSDLPNEARQKRLAELCEGDDALRAEVQSLLRHLDVVDDSFLSGQIQITAHRQIPESIGPYRIDRLLGEGGMGTVYLADQAGPLSRKVAVKVMAFATHHSGLTQRFLSERRALARLTHPNVAQVYDAGTTEDGMPYFAMEFVEGSALPEYCDEHRLDLNQRIRLFLAICAGVQHAHQRGIIHRDLKPSNLLVSTREGQPTPKIIDFGIAKDLEPDDDATPTLTIGPIGTPDYMSPEQMGADSIVDTRSDVYSLGMILYEVLTGTLPHDPETLRKLSLPQRLRHRSETDSPRPSNRLREIEHARGAAKARHTTPDALRRALRSDLDWIVLRAIETDPDRRYSSPAELAEDLRRFLNHRPVMARPPDRSYLLRKAIRRNPVAWSIGVGALVLLLAFLSILVVQNRRIIREQERVAEEAVTTQRVVDFLVEMFSQPDPRTGQVETAEEILQIGRERIADLEATPQVRARLLLTMGVVHTEMGLLDDGRTLLEESVTLLSLENSDPAQRATAQDALATCLRQTGELDRAESIQRAALETRLAMFGPDDIRTLSAQSNLAVIHQIRGETNEADRLFRQALARWPADSRGTQRAIAIRHNLATVAMERRDFAEAESLLTRIAAERAELLGPQHLETLEARSNLAFCYAETGRMDEAIELWETVLVMERAELGPAHPQSLRSATNLASAYADIEAFERADTLLVEILEVSREALGDTGRGTLAALNNLGTLRLRQGRWEKGIELFQEELSGIEQSLGEDSPNYLRAQANLAVAHRGAGNYAEAERLFLAVLEKRTNSVGAKDPDTLRTTSSLGIVYERQKRWADAERFHRAAYDGRREVLGPSNRSTIGSLRNLIRTLVQSGKSEEALRLAQQGQQDGLDVARLLSDESMVAVANDDAWRNLAGP